MLDGLLGRGFGAKCKSLIKLTKSRIEVIRRKRNATLKFLKKDMAELLANGLDINAYGRAEGLLAELTVSYSYDCVEEYCDFVLNHLIVMQKMRHCPEDCREAVSSLMFAAARFSDLPELRDLRQIFYERYGNTVELFANQKFVENLSSKPFTKEKKIELMHKIAAEFSIRWDSRTCEQMMSKDSRPSVAQEQPKGCGSFYVTKDESKSNNGRDAIPKADKHDIPSKDSLANGQVAHIWLGGQDKNVPKRNEFHQESRHEPTSHGCKLQNFREAMTPKRKNHEYLSQVRREANVEMHEPWKEDVSLKSVKSGSSSERKGIEIVDRGSKQQFIGENTTPKKDGQYISNQGKPSGAPSYAVLESNNDGKESYFGSLHNIANSGRNGEGETRKLKPYYNNAIPPPYTKPNAKLNDNYYERGLGSSHKSSGINVFPINTTGDGRNDTGNRSEKFDTEVYYGGHEVESIEHARANGHKHAKNGIHQYDSIPNNIPKPRSSRRQSKSRSNRDNAGNEDTGGIKRRSRSRRRDDSRRGLQVLFDDEHHQKDEEERMIDKLLIHYSTKPSANEPGQVRRKSKNRRSHHEGPQGEEFPRHTSRDEPVEFPEVLPPRSISLPREQTAPSVEKKVLARAATFQADRSNEAKHVHPKLPDYDDLAARFAAMKGR